MLGDHDAQKITMANDYCNGWGHRSNWQAREQLSNSRRLVTVTRGDRSVERLHRATPFVEVQLWAKKEGEAKVRPSRKLSRCVQGCDIEAGVQRVNLENGRLQREGITEQVRLLRHSTEKVSALSLTLAHGWQKWDTAVSRRVKDMLMKLPRRWEMRKFPFGRKGRGPNGRQGSQASRGTGVSHSKQRCFKGLSVWANWSVWHSECDQGVRFMFEIPESTLQIKLISYLC